MASIPPTGGPVLSALPSLSNAGHGLGLIKTSPAAVSAKQAAAVHAEAAALPASVDLTPYAMPVGDQGQVGSCAAWAADYTALGYWENKQHLSAAALEPMYTYSQVTGGVDRGSSIEGNLYIDQTQGVDNQADYWQGNFDYTDQPTAPEKAHAANWKLSSYANLPIQPSSSSTLTQQSIETALAAGTPVVIGIPVYNNFFYVGTANAGYYAGPSGSFAGNHAITALGYNSNGLVIENSWGTGWGNHGYAILSWSFVNTYVFDAVAVSALHTGQPTSTTAPAVTGIVRQGQRLTASTGSWSPAVTSYAYQWQRADNSGRWANVSGATTSSYTPGTDDLGKNLRVLVTATNAGGAGAATSASVGPVGSGAPVNATAPGVTVTLRVGLTLTAGAGTWSPAATSYAYQWQRSADRKTWTNITGATGASYVATSDVAGAYLQVRVTATNSYGTGSAATSAVVGPISAAPYNVSVPVITGTPGRGALLQASVGTWSPAPTSYGYQWQKLPSGSSTWVTVSGATTSSYTPALADENAKLRVQVTGTNAYGQLAALSAATAAVKASPPANTVAPKLTGTVRLGHPLSASPGAWSGTGNAYAYQWQRSTTSAWSNISGATGSTYIPANGDAGASLRVVVTASNPDGAVSVASAATLKLA
jgi:hypothetical protein